MDPRIRMHDQLETLFGDAVTGSATFKGRQESSKAKHLIEDPERAAEEIETPPEVKASEAHLELMELFKEEGDYKGCKS